MGKRYKKLLIQEVALAGSPVNQENFLLIKDGGVSMNEKMKLASLILMKEDVPEVVKEELKKFIPKEGEVVEFSKDASILVKKDGDYEVQNKLNEKITKLEKDLKDVTEKLSEEGKKTIITKDMPKEVKERFEKLEKEVKEAREAEQKTKMEFLEKDLTGKVGDKLTKSLIGIYSEETSKEIDSIVKEVEGMRKMIKDLSIPTGHLEKDKDREKKIEEGIERIKKEKGITSDTEAYIELIKENPELS